MYNYNWYHDLAESESGHLTIVDGHLSLICMLLVSVDDNVHFYGFTASAGGRDISWTSLGVSLLIINLGQVTKSTNILAFCGGGPVLIFTTDFSLILKLASISRGGVSWYHVHCKA